MGELYLIIGGAGSGKSAYAEALAAALAEKAQARRIYLATMVPEGAEAAARIRRHRDNRAGCGFETIEQTCHLTTLEGLEGAVVLLEDLSNLLGNELFLPEGGGAEAVTEGIRHLRKQCGALVIVCNEIFSDGVHYTGEMQTYLETLGALHCRLAAQACRVTEVICGIPRIRKSGGNNGYAAEKTAMGGIV